MKHIRIFVLFALLVALLMPLTAHAQGGTVITITETDINNSYRVQNPIFRSVSNVVVDLQPGQLVISATLTYRRAGTHNVSVTLVPSITNGRIYWSATSAVIDGSAATASELTQINNRIGASWRTNFRERLPTGRASSITISDTQVDIMLQ